MLELKMLRKMIKHKLTKLFIKDILFFFTIISLFNAFLKVLTKRIHKAFDIQIIIFYLFHIPNEGRADEKKQGSRVHSAISSSHKELST